MKKIHRQRGHQGREKGSSRELHQKPDHKAYPGDLHQQIQM